MCLSRPFFLTPSFSSLLCLPLPPPSAHFHPFTPGTSASIQALVGYLLTFPQDPRAEEIIRSVRKAGHFIRSIQRADGSWYGSWAVCFCYGKWFNLHIHVITQVNNTMPLGLYKYVSRRHFIEVLTHVYIPPSSLSSPLRYVVRCRCPRRRHRHGTVHSLPEATTRTPRRHQR